MLFVCHCLNVSVEAILDRPPEDTLVTIDRRWPAMMRLVVRRSDAFCNTRIAGTLAVHQQGPWTLHRCVLCQTTVYASSVQCPNEILVGADMLHDPSAIGVLNKSGNFSDVFRILLPSSATNGEESTVNDGGQDHPPAVSSGNASVVHVRQLASDYLRQQRDEMEERIRRFVDLENQRFDELCMQAKDQQVQLVRHLQALPIGPPNVEPADGQVALSSLNHGPPHRHSSGGAAATAAPSMPNRVVGQPADMQNNDAMNVGAKTATDVVDPTPLLDDDQDLQGSEAIILTKPKRIRHSGGTGKAPKLVNQGFDTQGILFTMDDFDVIYAEPQMPHGGGDDGDKNVSTFDDDDNSSDEEEEGDAVGTLLDSSYKTSALKRSSAVDYDCSPSRGYKAMGTSLPVNIPAMTSRVRSFNADDNEYQQQQGLPEGGDLAASIHTLALTMQEADAPERLFGERPSRYRYRSRLRYP